MSSWVFHRTRTGSWSVRIGPEEREVLLQVVDEVLDLLGAADEPAARGPADRDQPERDQPGEESGADHPLDHLASRGPAFPPLEAPADPALARLLPDVSTDPAVAAEFRRLSEGDVRAAKVANLRTLRAALAADRVTVRPQDGAAVAAALTDLRLVVSERLGIRTDEDAEAVYVLALAPLPREPADASRAVLAALYAVLTQLQDSLVVLMLDQLPTADPH